MKNKEIKLANEYLNKLLNKEYGTPFVVSGVGDSYNLLVAIEKLRVQLAYIENEKQSNKEKIETETTCIIHDLKTPLAIIMGYAECLKDQIDDKDYASLIIEKVQALNSQVLKLLDVAKTNKQVQNQKTIIDSREFFVSELNKYKILAHSNGLNFKIVKNIPKCNLYENKEDLQSIIQNVVTNAISYNKPNGKIKVSFTRYKYFLCIKIQDTGKGISKEDLPFVFDKFFKADKSRSSLSGSGMGLYVTKELVNKYGGKITIHSKKDKGTVIYLLLPILEPRRRGLTSKMIDDLPYFAKLIFFLFAGIGLCPAYRLLRFEETYNFKYLAAGLCFIFLAPLLWLTDLLSIFLFNQITMLNDFD